MPIASELVDSLPALVPFIGPETLERRFGQKFKLRLGANESTFGPSPKAVEAMCVQARISQFYGDPEGWELRTALGLRHGVRPEEIVLAGGIDELLALFCRAFADPGSPVVTTSGSYLTFEYGARGAGLQIKRTEYRRDAIDLDALAEEAVRSDARIVYLANPDNPSGSWHFGNDVREFRKRLPTRSLLLLDEAYSDFASNEALGSFSPDDLGVVTLRTFSKAHGLAGMRVGYAIGHESVVRILDRLRLHFGVCSVALAGALASLRDPDHVAEVVAQTVVGRARLASFVTDLGLVPLPSATNFLTIDIGTKSRADTLLNRLLEQGVFVRKPALPPLDRCIRVTIGRPCDVDIFEPIFQEAVRSVAAIS